MEMQPLTMDEVKSILGDNTLAIVQFQRYIQKLEARIAELENQSPNGVVYGVIEEVPA